MLQILHPVYIFIDCRAEDL